MIEQLKSTQVQDFIVQHQHDDPVMLMLQSKKYPHLPMREIVGQIQARQKAANKLPQWLEKEGVIFPPALSMEQCSSEATARFKAKLVSGNTLADLTGGAGIDSFYFSDLFKKVIYVERNPELCELAAHNFSIFSKLISVCNQDAEEYLTSMKEQIDCVFLDPARRNSDAKKIFLLQDCEPDVLALQALLSLKSKSVLLKTSPMLDIRLALNSLRNVRRVYVVAVNNEVKEILYLLDFNWHGEIMIQAVTLGKEGRELDNFTFSLEKESEISIEFAMPQRYIFEPNKAILKAGAFKSVAYQYGLRKLHPHSHLYTSDKLVPFPGRVFRCLNSLPYQKKAVLKHLPSKKANITTRNFPDSVMQIRKKLAVKDGGENYLFATTNIEGKAVILICQKL